MISGSSFIAALVHDSAVVCDSTSFLIFSSIAGVLVPDRFRELSEQ